jgi:DNA-binding CsgD family transcriptional regulator
MALRYCPSAEKSSNAKIAQLLNITVRAVKYHVTEIFRKMDVTTRSELMKKAYELGDLQ